MVDMKNEALSRSAEMRFAPDKLKFKPGLNVRNLDSADHQAGIRKLADEIRAAGGVRVPLEIFSEDGHIYVAQGHRRLTAVRLLISEGFDIPSIPCRPEPKGRNDTDRIVDQYMTNNTSLPLTPLELSTNIKRLMVAGYTIASVARSHGVSESWVSTLLDLQGAPAEVKAMVEEGKVSPSMAAKTIRKEGATAGTAALKSAVTAANAEGKSKATPKHLDGGSLHQRLLDGVKELANKGNRGVQNLLEELEIKW